MCECVCDIYSLQPIHEESEDKKRLPANMKREHEQHETCVAGSYSAVCVSVL